MLDLGLEVVYGLTVRFGLGLWRVYRLFQLIYRVTHLLFAICGLPTRRRFPSSIDREREERGGCTPGKRA